MNLSDITTLKVLIIAVLLVKISKSEVINLI